MLINVDNLLIGESIKVDFSKNIALPKDYCEGDHISVNLNGTLRNNDGEYIFKGKVSTVLSLYCDLCLEKFSYDLTFDMSEVYSKTENFEKDYFVFSGRTIDLEPAVLSNILLNIPMKAVCSDGCKGLCDKCGHNLNESECGCDRTYINPKFEKLKILFEDDKEV